MHPTAATDVDAMLQADNDDPLADVLEVIQAASGHRLPPPARPNVWVEITEEPSSNGVRYRYASEGRASHLHGVRSTDAQPTFPAIRLAGPDVAAVGEFVVLISLVTDEAAPPYRPHPHKLIGDHCTEGFYQRAFHADDAGAEVAFESLGIQCMKRDENAASLRLREVRRINPYKTPPHQPRDTYDKNTVRLCFQVYVRMAAGGGGGERHRLRPVVSRPVRDKRDNLVIYKISHASGTARGRTHMILLCERVRKEDIDVEFRELDPHTREPVWMALGEFDESDVHRQVAIALRTPPYRDPNTAVPRTCAIRLRNRRTQATSEDLRFEYTPEPADGDVRRKRNLQSRQHLRSLRENMGQFMSAELHRQQQQPQQQQQQQPLQPEPPIPSFQATFGNLQSQPSTSAAAYGHQQQPDQPALQLPSAFGPAEVTAQLDSTGLPSAELSELARALVNMPAPPLLDLDLADWLMVTNLNDPTDHHP